MTKGIEAMRVELKTLKIGQRFRYLGEKPIYEVFAEDNGLGAVKVRDVDPSVFMAPIQSVKGGELVVPLGPEFPDPMAVVQRDVVRFASSEDQAVEAAKTHRLVAYKTKNGKYGACSKAKLAEMSDLGMQFDVLHDFQKEIE